MQLDIVRAARPPAGREGRAGFFVDGEREEAAAELAKDVEDVEGRVEGGVARAVREGRVLVVAVDEGGGRGDLQRVLALLG